MIVLDASAVIDLLLNLSPRSDWVRERIAECSPQLHAPHLLDAEIAQVLRRYVIKGEIKAQDAVAMIEDYAQLSIVKHSHLPLIHRAFELRDNVTIYDALYLVLAEMLGATLLTSDSALARVPGHRAKVELTVDRPR